MRGDGLLMLDSSSPVANDCEECSRAAEVLAAPLAFEDRVSLLKFDDRVELLQDWTASRVQLRRALRRLQPGMFTRFNDALYLAAREQFKDPTRRRAAVVLSDGIDSGRGQSSAAQALRALLEASVGVYCISNTGIERARKSAELDALLDALDPTAELPPGSEALPRGHVQGPRAVVLPEHWLRDADDPTPPDDAGAFHSGG